MLIKKEPDSLAFLNNVLFFSMQIMYIRASICRWKHLIFNYFFFSLFISHLKKRKKTTTANLLYANDWQLYVLFCSVRSSYVSTESIRRPLCSHSIHMHNTVCVEHFTKSLRWPCGQNETCDRKQNATTDRKTCWRFTTSYQGCPRYRG